MRAIEGDSHTVITVQVTRPEDIRGFFDREAPFIEERHGPAEPALRYRIGLVRTYFPASSEINLLDVGCGTGNHILALAPFIRRGTGIDFSTAMIERARIRAQTSPWREKITFFMDNAQELKTITDTSIDVVICIGTLEHVPNKALLLSQAHRVLRPSGKFVCLTPNGSYAWYSLASRLRIPTKHLSTDAFLSAEVMSRCLRQARFDNVEIGYWSFVPRGDIGRVAASALRCMDMVGRALRINSFRGGLLAVAEKGMVFDAGTFS